MQDLPLGSKAVYVCVLALAFAASASLLAQRTALPSPVDDHYILALSAADEFLHAWATRDVEAGRATLTPAAVGRYSAEGLATLIQGVSSPHHESYEIGPGHRETPTKYVFDVIQYEYLTNMNVNEPRPAPARLVVVEIAPNSWRIDEFPHP